MKTLQQTDWEETYKPEMDGEDLLEIGFSDPRVTSHPLHIWTQLDIGCACETECDSIFGEVECPSLGDPWIYSGAHYVNRLAYFFCEVPYESTDDIGVQ